MASTDSSNYRPEPTRLVLFNEVDQQDPGTKIRFLGCVHEYRISSGVMVLRDDFPTTTDAGSTIIAKVDNEMLSLKPKLVELGAWLNIIGYVRKPPKPKGSDRRATSKDATSKTGVNLPMVDATMVWSAGAIKHDKYQAAAKRYRPTT